MRRDIKRKNISRLALDSSDNKKESIGLTCVAKAKVSLIFCEEEPSSITADRSIVSKDDSKQVSLLSLSSEVIQIDNENVLKMFTTSKNYLAANTMNQLSYSIFGPKQKQYFMETSLFYNENETVLVFGGIDPHAASGTGPTTGRDIFRYIPISNTWENVGEMPEPRHHHSVQLLRGRVYLVGGVDPRDCDIKGISVVVDSTWSYEPVHRSWFHEGSLKVARKNFGLEVCNKRMYAIGGRDRHSRPLETVESFNPLKSAWSRKASMKLARAGFGCTKYRQHIWVAGGLTGAQCNELLDAVESYDVRTDQWTEIMKLDFPRCFTCMIVMTDRIYMIGGAAQTMSKERATTSINNLDVLEPSQVEWKPRSVMAIPRHGHVITYIGPQILIIGGVTTIYMKSLSNVECFCTYRGIWVKGFASLPIPLSGHAAVTLPPADLMRDNM